MHRAYYYCYSLYNFSVYVITSNRVMPLELKRDTRGGNIEIF
jgi:hypothetical protein